MKLQSIMHSLVAPRGTLKFAKEAVMALDTHQNHCLSTLRDQMSTARTKSQFLDLAEQFVNYLDFLTTKAKDYTESQARRKVSELNCYVWLPLNCGTADKASAIAAARAVCPMIADDLNDYTFESLQTRAAQWIDVMHYVLDHYSAPEGEPQPYALADDKVFAAYWRNSDTMNLMAANREYCAMRDEASKMNLGIIQAEKIITAMDGQPGAKEAASGCLMRDDHNEIDFMVEVAARLSVLAQPCSAARNNAHYYELLVAKRQRKGYVAMTQINLAYQYILNDAIAGDMVKSCDVYRMEIIFRDGSWFQLVETMTTDITPHGFYVKTQDKLA